MHGVTQRKGVNFMENIAVQYGITTPRIKVLAEKLFLEQNMGLQKRIEGWIEESEGYADKMIERYGLNKVQSTRKGYQLLYILNHLCPSLYHFHKRPDPMRYKGDTEGYNRASLMHTRENTQVELVSRDGTLIQTGIHYTDEEYDIFLGIVAPLRRKDDDNGKTGDSSVLPV